MPGAEGIGHRVKVIFTLHFESKAFILQVYMLLIFHQYFRRRGGWDF